MPYDLPAAILAHIPQNARAHTVKDKPRVLVLRIEAPDGVLFLKRMASGIMDAEAEMCAYLSHFGLGPGVVAYEKTPALDYLLMEELPGGDALTLIKNGDRTEALQERIGEAVRALHNLPASQCPVDNPADVMLERAKINYRKGLASDALMKYLGKTSLDNAYRELLELEPRVSFTRRVIHGDCCYPNFQVGPNGRVRFLDLPYGGVGDPHYDLFWVRWSADFNLSADPYFSYFLRSYGRENADPDAIRFFGLISAFNGFRGCDYYDLWKD